MSTRHLLGCTITDDGTEFLRTYLNLPSEIVPATLKKSTKPPGRLGGPPGDRPRGPPCFEGDRPRFGDRDGVGVYTLNLL
ncbi:hypothetical protein Goklo_018644, partial [Gossypium klotzschianum]|nr:hypothetical protein [Gossypium klotzschianum]